MRVLVTIFQSDHHSESRFYAMKNLIKCIISLIGWQKWVARTSWASWAYLTIEKR